MFYLLLTPVLAIIDKNVTKIFSLFLIQEKWSNANQMYNKHKSIVTLAM